MNKILTYFCILFFTDLTTSFYWNSTPLIHSSPPTAKKDSNFPKLPRIVPGDDQGYWYSFSTEGYITLQSSSEDGNLDQIQANYDWTATSSINPDLQKLALKKYSIIVFDSSLLLLLHSQSYDVTNPKQGLQLNIVQPISSLENLPSKDFYIKWTFHYTSPVLLCDSGDGNPTHENLSCSSHITLGQINFLFEHLKTTTITPLTVSNIIFSPYSPNYNYLTLLPYNPPHKNTNFSHAFNSIFSLPRKTSLSRTKIRKIVIEVVGPMVWGLENPADEKSGRCFVNGDDYPFPITSTIYTMSPPLDSNNSEKYNNNSISVLELTIGEEYRGKQLSFLQPHDILMNIRCPDHTVRFPTRTAQNGVLNDDRMDILRENNIDINNIQISFNIRFYSSNLTFSPSSPEHSTNLLDYWKDLQYLSTSTSTLNSNSRSMPKFDLSAWWENQPTSPHKTHSSQEAYFPDVLWTDIDVILDLSGDIGSKRPHFDDKSDQIAILLTFPEIQLDPTIKQTELFESFLKNINEIPQQILYAPLDLKTFKAPTRLIKTLETLGTFVVSGYNDDDDDDPGSHQDGEIYFPNLTAYLPDGDYYGLIHPISDIYNLDQKHNIITPHPDPSKPPSIAFPFHADTWISGLDAPASPYSIVICRVQGQVLILYQRLNPLKPIANEVSFTPNPSKQGIIPLGFILTFDQFSLNRLDAVSFSIEQVRGYTKFQNAQLSCELSIYDSNPFQSHDNLTPIGVYQAEFNEMHSSHNYHTSWDNLMLDLTRIVEIEFGVFIMLDCSKTSFAFSGTLPIAKQIGTDLLRLTVYDENGVVLRANTLPYDPVQFSWFIPPLFLMILFVALISLGLFLCLGGLYHKFCHNKYNVSLISKNREYYLPAEEKGYFETFCPCFKTPPQFRQQDPNEQSLTFLAKATELQQFQHLHQVELSDSAVIITSSSLDKLNATNHIHDSDPSEPSQSQIDSRIRRTSLTSNSSSCDDQFYLSEKNHNDNTHNNTHDNHLHLDSNGFIQHNSSVSSPDLSISQINQHVSLTAKNIPMHQEPSSSSRYRPINPSNNQFSSHLSPQDILQDSNNRMIGGMGTSHHIGSQPNFRSHAAHPGIISRNPPNQKHPGL